MAGAVFSFVAMAVAGREISAEMNTFELMLYRSIIGFIVVLLLLRRSKHGFLQVKTKNIGQHITRNILHFSTQNLWFYGIAVIPLSQLVALEFTNPIWVVLLAPLLLGETLTRKKLFVALLGFIGVLIVAQPGVQPIGWGHASGLGAALGFALNNMMTSKIMRVDRVLTVLFWMTLMQLVFAFFSGAAGRDTFAKRCYRALACGGGNLRAYGPLLPDNGAIACPCHNCCANGFHAVTNNRDCRNGDVFRAIIIASIHWRKFNNRRQSIEFTG